jgi:N-formylmaleamate deformylase
MSDWFSGDVVAHGIKIHYYRTGGDKPVVVLAHGATDNGWCWTRLTRALEADYDVIMPDARGHGLSDAPETGYSSVDHAADLAGLIQALGLERPAVGGHSMGAATTLQLVGSHPAIARCAILEDPPIWVGSTRPARPGTSDPRSAIRRQVTEAKSAGRAAAMALGRAAFPLWSEEEFGVWADAKQHVSDYFLDRPGGVPGEGWQELLPRVTCPILLVTSDPERGGIVTPEAAQEAQKLQPALQVVRLRGAGHNIRREQFEPFVATVREFLARTTAPAPVTAHV